MPLGGGNNNLKITIMKAIILNGITSKKSANFDKKVQKLLPEGVNEIYLSSCGMKRLGTGSYNFFLEIQINNEDRLTLHSHTNSSPAWDFWQDIEAGTVKHDNWNKNTGLMLLEENQDKIIELLIDESEF